MTDLREALQRTQSKPLRGALERTRASRGRRPPSSSALVWQGPWSPEVRYLAGDCVEFEGSSWRSLISHVNVEPPHLPQEASAVWELVAKKGEDGAAGPRGFIGATGPQGPPGPGSELSIEDEGVLQGTATVLDLVGAGVTATVAGGTATITIPGGVGGGHVIEDEGVPLAQRADLNFVGAGVTAADAGGVTVVTIPGGGAVAFDDPDPSVFGDTMAQGVDGDAARADHHHDRHDDAVLFLSKINA